MTTPTPPAADPFEFEGGVRDLLIGSPLYRYAAVLLQLAITVLGAFVILPADAFADIETGIPAGLSLLSVAVGAVGVYFAPLLGERHSSVLKVAVAVATGIIASIIPFVASGDFSAQSIGFLAFTVLSGIATKVGVEIRKDGEQQAA